MADFMFCKEIKVKKSYDVVVCGGGVSGFAAAYSAAREGSRVLLIERKMCLGGVGTSCNVNHILGERTIIDGEIVTCVAGLFETLEKRLIKSGGGLEVDRDNLDLSPHGWRSGLAIGFIFDKEAMKLELEKMLGEVGVDILYDTTIIDVVKKDLSISELVVHNKSGLFAVGGKYYIDATGDGDVLELSGCKTIKGDDEGGMAAASLEMHLENVDHNELTEYMKSTGDVRFINIINELKEKGEWDFDYDIFISVMLTQNDVFMINTIRQVGVDGTDGDSVSRSVIDGRAENYRLLEVARKYFPGFKNATVRSIAPYVGIRETRRLLGEYVLTVEDLLADRAFDDSIAVSGYGWDLPHPKKPSLQPLHTKEFKRKRPYTHIPYRCLLPKEIKNLITAGRCISVEREVLGPIRVMGPCIAMGEAAGIAAGMAFKEGISFKDVDVSKLREKIIGYGGIVSR